MLEVKILDEIEDLEITNGDLVITEGDIDLVHVNKKLKLPLKDDAASPTISFGDGDSGFYEGADDIIGISIAGIAEFVIENDKIRAINAAGPVLLNEGCTATNPTLIPDRSDLDTGISSNGSNQLSLIAGGDEALRITETVGHVSASGSILDVSNGIPKLNASAKVPDVNLESPVSTHSADTTSIHGITDTSKLCVISTGTYTGDGSVNRAIAHGLGVVPKFVKITATGALSPIMEIIELGIIHFMDAVNYDNLSVTTPTTTNFYIGNATDYAHTANTNAATYGWVAYG
ncbi:MAG: hypothetical protein KAI81_04320 [Candidatus Marinimicrobia bacterium]|nr:hypothetical protein [Candidatus Neomarinimicrobiota bacterium]